MNLRGEILQSSNNTRIAEIKTICRRYKRTNSHIHSKIDWALGNAEWLTIFPHTEAVLMHPYFLDHTPLTITIEAVVPMGKRPSKFINSLADHRNFHQVIKKAWTIPVTGYAMAKIWRKLKHVRRELKKLKINEFSNVDQKILVAREKLQEIQTLMTDYTHPEELYNKELETKQQLQRQRIIQEGILKQKARVTWLKIGDSNSKYFFASMKCRQTQNQIKRLTDANGDLNLYYFGY